MNHDQRMRLAFGAIRRFYARYSPPAKMPPDVQAQEIQAVAEAVARHMPTNMDEQGYTERLNRALSRVADNNRTRSWPTQGEVVKALRDVNDTAQMPVVGTPVEDEFSKYLRTAVLVEYQYQDCIRGRKETFQEWRANGGPERRG